MRVQTLALVAWLAIGAQAVAQVPVTDAARTTAEGVAAEQTKKIETTNKRANTLRSGSLCSIYRGTDGPVAGMNANKQITDMIRRIAREEGVQESDALAIAHQESRFNPCAKSPVGATGLMQLMPGTASDLGVNPHDPEQNVRGGLRYYKTQLAKFGSKELALAAYNAGPGNVRKYGGIPPFKETQGYVANITGKWMPAFGGATSQNDVLSPRFEAASSSAMNAAGLAAANRDSTAGVTAFYQGKAQEAGREGTLLESLDANTDARIANVETWNRAILTATAFVELYNALNVSDAADKSGAAETFQHEATFNPITGKAEPGAVATTPGAPAGNGPNPAEPSPPIVLSPDGRTVVGAPDGRCFETDSEDTVDPDCVTADASAEPMNAQQRVNALVNSILNPAPAPGTTVIEAR